jgi:predicted short-subunit dehydrogenase-like oxidoreductase (DUF2520 family)
MKVVLLGSGNVATHLGLALKQAGNDILAVWSRNLVHAEELALQLGAEPTNQLEVVSPTADIYIISVVDDAIEDIAHQLSIKDRIVVHTSGTTGINALNGTSVHTGVLYPLQTFSKQKDVNFSNVPVAIEGSSQQVMETLEFLVRQITGTVLKIDSTQRLSLHVAAVFACNFTNHLCTLSKEILSQNQLDFHLLRPLIAETAAKVQEFEPETVQTGPAIRQDLGTLDKHQEFLRKNPDLLELYNKLSHSIINSSQSSRA